MRVPRTNGMVALIYLGHDVLEFAVIKHAHVHMLDGEHLREEKQTDGGHTTSQ